ncbi:hypothetical protein [Faecalibacter bovis]|uniref:EcsC family protein n=1 Tax=Faecalibacter bovis TaxID=2898187 RepID=A0ABX7XCD8_9FLAO|nr:hypothetical protein [Faecalibacter bovis]QTV05563.1 hypothetical protein J9309_12450 [Faecalibacter bovis]
MKELNSINKKSFDFIKEIPYFEELQEKMTTAIMESFDDIIKDRISYHSNYQFYQIDESALKKTYNSYANKDGIMNGLGNIVPGGSSYFTMLPLIINSYKNQTKMICDLAVQMGKKDSLHSKEVVMAILLSTAGESANQLMANQANKILIKSISSSLTPKLMEKIGTNLLSKSLSSIFTTAVPGIGALAIGMFVRYNTKQLGKMSISILSKDIQISNHFNSEAPTEDINVSYNATEIRVEVIKVFVNLMKIDSNKQSSEIGYILSLIKFSNLDDKDKIMLFDSLTDEKFFHLNYDILKLVSDKNLLVFDMLAFCNIDGAISLKEIAYISKILKRLELGTICDYVI